MRQYDWREGVVGVTMNNCLKDASEDLHWMLFDGPIDPGWIENMNSLLDDNKKLCLNSGQILTMNNKIKVIFEAEDLRHASLATVSRCGIVYVGDQMIVDI